MHVIPPLVAPFLRSFEHIFINIFFVISERSMSDGMGLAAGSIPAEARKPDGDVLRWRHRHRPDGGPGVSGYMEGYWVTIILALTTMRSE